MKLQIILIVFSCCVVVNLAQSSTTPKSPQLPRAQATTTPTDSAEAELECATQNSSCEVCVKHAKCLWCDTNAVVKCVPYPVGEVIPQNDVCDLEHARWGSCWVNYKTLLITMGCVAGVIFIAICSCCIYCCCCKSSGRRASYQRDEARHDEERENRQTRHAERRAERQTRVDDIRRKYGLGLKVPADKDEGLMRDSDASYKRFDNEA